MNPNQNFCSVCHDKVPPQELVRVNTMWVCGDCHKWMQTPPRESQAPQEAITERTLDAPGGWEGG